MHGYFTEKVFTLVVKRTSTSAVHETHTQYMRLGGSDIFCQVDDLHGLSARVEPSLCAPIHFVTKKTFSSPCMVHLVASSVVKCGDGWLMTVHIHVYMWMYLYFHSCWIY